jgi:hypothetical protein
MDMAGTFPCPTVKIVPVAVLRVVCFSIILLLRIKLRVMMVGLAVITVNTFLAIAHLILGPPLLHHLLRCEVGHRLLRHSRLSLLQVVR